MTDTDHPDKQRPIPKQDKSRIEELMDQPCTNPRYGGLTIREATRKILLRGKSKPEIMRKPK